MAKERRYNLSFEDGREFNNISLKELINHTTNPSNENIRYHAFTVDGEYIPNKYDMEDAIRDSRKQFFRDAYGY